MYVEPTLGFEIEAYLAAQGAIFRMNKAQGHRFNGQSRDDTMFHSILDYALEAKTIHPSKSPLRAAKNALVSLDLGLECVRKITQNHDLEAIAHPTGEGLVSKHPLYLLGTHIHIGYKQIQDALSEAQSFAQPKDVVWVMRQSLPSLLAKYSPSLRMRERLALKSENPAHTTYNDFEHLDVSGESKRTINYRKGIGKPPGTIEFSFPDSTADLDLLCELGLDAQRLAQESVEFLCGNPDFRTPPPKARAQKMRALLQNYL